jgi:hypothetical protein
MDARSEPGKVAAAVRGGLRSPRRDSEALARKAREATRRPARVGEAAGGARGAARRRGDRARRLAAASRAERAAVEAEEALIDRIGAGVGSAVEDLLPTRSTC